MPASDFCSEWRLEPTLAHLRSLLAHFPFLSTNGLPWKIKSLGEMNPTYLLGTSLPSFPRDARHVFRILPHSCLKHTIQA